MSFFPFSRSQMFRLGVRALFSWALCTGMYVLLTVFLSIYFGGSTYGEQAFGGLFFPQLIALEVLCAQPLLIASALAGAFSVDQRLFRSLLGWVYLLLLGLFFASIVAGWGHYTYSGQFPPWDSYLFYLSAPVHFMEHALAFSPLASILAVLLWGLLLLPVTLCSRWMLRRVPTNFQALISIVSSAVLLSGAYLFAPTTVLQLKGTETGQLRLAGDDASVRSSTIEDLLESYLLGRSGPWTSLWLPLFRDRRVFEPDSKVLAVAYSERVSVAEYASMATSSVDELSLPNVVIILVESLRDDILRGESHRGTMPHLEALASAGVYFQNHYSSSSHSSYADISAISGLYPLWSERIHLYAEKPPAYVRPRLYDVLGALGARAGIFSSQNETWGAMQHYLNSEYLDAFYHAGDLSIGKALLGRTVALNSGKGFDRDTIEIASQWIGVRERPFVAYINLQGSHYPYYFPDEGNRPFGSEFNTSEFNFLNLPDEVIPMVWPRYRDSLYYVDQQIGSLIANLKERGQWENTLLVVTGDTGQAFGEHGFTGHARDLYDEVLRTPLIFSGGWLNQSGGRGRLSQHADIAPSVLDLIGLPPYAGFQGISLFGTQERIWAPLVCQSPALKQVGLVTLSEKLLFNWTSGEAVWFDLLTDPQELYPLPVEASRPQMLKRILETWVFHQIDYYGSVEQSRKYFAPRYKLQSYGVEH